MLKLFNLFIHVFNYITILLFYFTFPPASSVCDSCPDPIVSFKDATAESNLQNHYNLDYCHRSSSLPELSCFCDVF